MAKGWDGVEQSAAALAAQREKFAEGFKPTLKVNQKNPGPYQIRFLEQGPDVNSFKVHEYKEPNNSGGFYTKQFTCLSEIGQACPGCQAGLKQKIRGVYNLIQRNRPVLQKDQNNKAMRDAAGNYIVIGYEDAVVIANVGSLTAEMLRKADGTYQGLMSRDFTVMFSGETFQAWNMSPVLDGAGNAMAAPMSEADFALAAQKHDIDEFMKPPTQQEAAQIVARYGQNSGASPNASPQGVPAMGNAGQAGAANGFLAGAAVPAGMAGGAFGAAQQVAQPPAPPVPAPAVTVPAAAAPALDPGVGQPVVPMVNADQTVTQGAPVAPVAPVPPAPAPPQQ